jgi:hypothetical protein
MLVPCFRWFPPGTSLHSHPRPTSTVRGGTTTGRGLTHSDSTTGVGHLPPVPRFSLRNIAST